MSRVDFGQRKIGQRGKLGASILEISLPTMQPA